MMMSNKNTASLLLCVLLATLLLLNSITASAAAPACNENNFICLNSPLDVFTPGAGGACNCCARNDSSNCEAAQTRCTSSFYSCSAGKTVSLVDDSCQCCDENDAACEAAQSTCPSNGHILCTACEDGKCTSCVSGLVPDSEGICIPPCVVPNCRYCQRDDPRMCSVCKDKYVLTEENTCKDGVFGLQSSYIAAAAAMLAMLVALVA